MWEVTRRAFVEFLTIPTLVIIGFFVLALITFVLDEARNATAAQGQEELWGGLFSDPQATRDFLGVIASSIITVTSITLSLLLIAVQQGAAALTSLVFDQFLRRRTNQFYFGFFIGLALFSLLVLASINPGHQPTYGVAVAGLMTVAALYMLILLIYTTIDQMRPVVIIKSIHDHTLTARGRQHQLLRDTRRRSRLQASGSPVTADRSGFLVWFNADAMAKAVADTESEAEIVILVSIGDYVAIGDSIMEIRGADRGDMSDLAAKLRNAVALEEQRNLDSDPAYGIEQLAIIGWTSISTAKSNPGPGLLTIWNLRDLLAHWLQTDSAFKADVDYGEDAEAPVVYLDNLPRQVLRSFESLAVVASESIQHQSAAEIYRSFAKLFPHLTPALQRQVDDLLLRSLSALGDHVPTGDLDEALSALADVVRTEGWLQCADAIVAAQNQLGSSIGRLNSRGTRTGGGK